MFGLSKTPTTVNNVSGQKKGRKGDEEENKSTMTSKQGSMIKGGADLSNDEFLSNLK